MARLLLGVSGGIAAYKALEAARLAIKAGHAVRVIQTPTSAALRGRAPRSRRSPARPVLPASSSPTPPRLLPGRAAAGAGADQPPGAGRARRAVPDRAASANTIAKLAHGHADNLLTAAALAAACPVAVAPAMNNRMYLHPATQANLEQLARARRDDHRAGRGRARLARRARRRPAGRAGRAARGLRGAARRRRDVWVRAAACWSPRAGPASRSTASATSPTAPRDGWGSRSPRRRRAAAPRSRWSPPTRAERAAGVPGGAGRDCGRAAGAPARRNSTAPTSW